MRRFFLLTVAGIVAVCAVSVGLASAGGGSQTTQFDEVYFVEALQLQHNCTGTRVVQKDGTVKDSGTCILSGAGVSHLVPGTITGNPDYTLGGVHFDYWGSDHDGLHATSVILKLIDNGNGTFTQKVTAYYPHL